jgi:hypothetical protein
MNRVKKDLGKIFLIFAFIVLGCLGVSGKGQAIEPKITDIIITSNAENVLVYAGVANGFKTEMESAILAGVPTVFTIQLEVYRVRSYLWDKKIASSEIKRTIKYDNLKKTFNIFTDGDEAPAIFADFESAQKAMADLSGIVIVPLKELVKGNTYYLKMRVKIDKVRLPLHMEYVFFFVSFWDFETAWYKQSFSY